MRTVLAIVLLLLGIQACKQNEVTEDANLFGNWSDDLVRYNFDKSMDFGKKALVDDPFDTLNLDSSWGTYEVFNNEILVFTFEGYLLENGTKIDTTFLGPTWNYSIEGNVMRYTSSTNVGKLTKEP